MLQHWTKTPATSDLTQLTQDIAELKQLIQTGITAVKSIQRGVTTQATTITIDAVDMSKAVVLSNSKASEGEVRARGSISSSGNIAVGSYYAGNTADAQNGLSIKFRYDGSNKWVPNGSADYLATISQSGSITPSGTTNLTTRQYSARLTSETTLECDGAVEWQVIEYN